MQTHLAGSAGFHCVSSKKQLKTRQPAQSSGPAQSGGHYDIDLVVAVCCGNKPLPDYNYSSSQTTSHRQSFLLHVRYVSIIGLCSIVRMLPCIKKNLWCHCRCQSHDTKWFWNLIGVPLATKWLTHDSLAIQDIPSAGYFYCPWAV